MDAVKSAYLLGWSVTVGLTVLVAELSFAALTGAMAQVPLPQGGPTTFDVGNFVGNAALAAIFWWVVTKTMPAREAQRDAVISDLAKCFRDESSEQRKQHMATITAMQEGFERRQQAMLDAIREGQSG